MPIGYSPTHTDPHTHLKIKEEKKEYKLLENTLHSASPIGK